MPDKTNDAAATSVLEQLRRPADMEPIARDPEIHQAFLEDVAAAMQAAGLTFHVTPASSSLLLDTRLRVIDERTGVRLGFVHGIRGHVSRFRVDWYSLSTDREVFTVELLPLDPLTWALLQTDKAGGGCPVTRPALPEACGSAADARAILGILTRFYAALPADNPIDDAFFEGPPPGIDTGASPHAPRYDQL